jgi:uncharacterized lipoprotein YehR (DUF1307 family)
MIKYLKIVLLISIVSAFSCVQKEHEKKVTFYVDANGEENVKSIGIKGDFYRIDGKKRFF